MRALGVQSRAAPRNRVIGHIVSNDGLAAESAMPCDLAAEYASAECRDVLDTRHA